jgi:non-ribosomal peptide synthetase component E (peptide arylation enzyme)
MLDGVTPVPAEFAARYRERGYWADQPLFEGFTGALARYADRTALVDDEGPVSYRELSGRSAHLYNSRIAAAVCAIGAGDVLLDVLPIEHNLPLGCPGMQGFLLSGGTVVLGASTRPRDVFGLIQRHRVTHIHLVPALLIRWVDDPAVAEYDLSSVRVIQSGGQRLQPEVRLRAERALPGCFIQENFGMAEGLIMFVRSCDPPGVRRETDEMTAVALHKGNVFWELSGWAPKYFPASLRTDIRGRLREKMMFGSDHPSLPYERILREWDELGYDQSVLDLVFHANAERVLGL